MATYLQLCRDLCREVGIPGGDTVPVSVMGQRGELQRVVKWIESAYTDIQNKHSNWRWMRNTFSLNTHENQDAYPSSDCFEASTGYALTRFSRWYVNNPDDRVRCKQASYQVIDVGGSIKATSPTGLANDSTNYIVLVSVGGTVNPISIAGWDAQTYEELVLRINFALSGAAAELSNGNFRFIADFSTGADISVTDNNLLSSLTEFVGIKPAVSEGNEYSLNYIDWDSYKTIFRVSNQNNSAPSFVTVDPQNNLVFGPTPDAGYVITGDFYRSPQSLITDFHVPEMPSQYHSLIWYYAMRKYAYHESATELLVRFKEEAIPILRTLEINQLPEPELGEPLA